MTPRDYGRTGGRASAALRLADALDDIHEEIPGLSDLQAKQVLRLVIKTKDAAYIKGYRRAERRRTT